MEENKLSHYRFSIYKHNLVVFENRLINRKFITLTDLKGNIIAFTEFHKYIHSSNKRGAKSVSDNGNNRFDFVVQFLNYILLEHYEKYKINNLTEIEISMLQDFFRDYGLNKEIKRKKQTVDRCTTSVIEFLSAYIDANKNRCLLKVEDFTKEVKYTTKKGKIKTKKIPNFEIFYYKSDKKIFRDMPNSVFMILMSYSAEYYKDIFFMMALSAFAGLRPSEACNITQEISPLGSSLIFRKINGKTSRIIIDLTKEQNLRSDLKSVGSIKKERKQDVYPDFIKLFESYYTLHKEYLKNQKFEKDYCPMFVNSRGMAMTYPCYRARFKKMISNLIPILFNSTDPEVVEYAHDLTENNISPHVFRHWFSVFLTLKGEDIAQLQYYRGDKSPESSFTYIQNKGELNKQLNYVNNQLFDFMKFQSVKLKEGELNEKMVSIKDFLHDLSNKNNVRYNNQFVLYSCFITFMNDNDWFNIKSEFLCDEEKSDLLIDSNKLNIIKCRVETFFLNKDLSVSQKINLLIDMIKEKYPHTNTNLQYFFKKYKIDEDDQYILLDFVLWSLDKDLQLYSNREIEDLIQICCDTLTKRLGYVFLAYLDWLKETHIVNFNYTYTFSKRVTRKLSEAYDTNTYLSLIYYLFAPNYIENNCMYEKAIENKETANTWLYLAIHCICALRDTDIKNIPHPRLKYSPNEIFELISEEEFTDIDAKLVTSSVIWQLKNLPFSPSKSARYSEISDINLIFPESTTVLFGILFAINEAHYLLSDKKEEPLIYPVKDYESICKYLGDEIGELFLARNFSSISASKTYMQAIELLADDILDNEKNLYHTKGYMLAALARSHKGSIGEFASTTEIYLKDAHFSGYTPEFVAKELFERGVCSFIPSILLKMVTEGNYDKISITSQTELIKTLDMTPYEVEQFITSIDSSLKNSQTIVKSILTNDLEIDRKNIIEILHNIGCGAAISKTPDCLCLLTAMGKNCIKPGNQQCLNNCDYEIRTKSAVYLLGREFHRLLELREFTSLEHMKIKYTMLLKSTVAPALKEIFVSIRAMYGKEAEQELVLLMKEMGYE